MARFFRKFRLEQAEKGRFRRYIPYALGEVLLIVVGILIALQIDRWNEDRKEKTVEGKYLVALKSEFENNLKEVNRALSVCDTVFKACMTLIESYEDNNQLSSYEFGMANRVAFRDAPKFVESPGILNDLTNSGNLNKLSNDNLRFQIQLWYKNKQELETREKELWEYKAEAVNYFLEKSSIRNIFIALDESTLGQLIPSSDEIEINRIQNDKYFDNLVMMYSINIKNHQTKWYPMIKKNIESILVEIDNSLNSN